MLLFADILWFSATN